MAMQRHVRIVEDETESVAQGCVRIAFATSDLRHVDQHFGSAERFAIYEVQRDQARLLEVAEFGAKKQDGNEDKLLEKFVLMNGCAAVYSLAIGPSAVRQLMGLGVQPIRVPEHSTINALLNGLQHELQEGPSGWLARALSAKDKKEERFDSMLQEQWEE
ncbi:MAG TPA: NifB/NifX family molybdenum-iron cluster-binding protein [Gammaproteobacteria bacterium]